VFEIVVEDLQLRGTIAAEVGEDRVGVGDEALERRAPLGRAQLQRDRLLVVAERLEEERVLTLLERRHVPTDVALAGRVLDLDDASAEVGQVHGAPRAGAVLLDGEDGDVFEWSAHG